MKQKSNRRGQTVTTRLGREGRRTVTRLGREERRTVTKLGRKERKTGGKMQEAVVQQKRADSYNKTWQRGKKDSYKTW